MNTLARQLSLCVSLVLGAGAAQAQQSCEEAWAAYNEFKQHNVMEESQYPYTEQGAAVRAACGQEALPVPPGSDTPHRPILRKWRKPPPELPKAPPPAPRQ